MIVAKVHKSEDGRMVLAVCDKDLLGKKFEQGELLLDLTSDFYDGKEVKEEDLKMMFKGSYVVNVVGKESVAMALKEGIIQQENVVKVKDVPYAQALIGE